MLIQIDPHRQTTTQLPGLAHIVVAIQRDGTLHMQAFRQGAFSASYANKSDSVLAQIPALLAELRDELAADAAQLPVVADRRTGPPDRHGFVWPEVVAPLVKGA